MKLEVRTRHRAPLIKCEISHTNTVTTITLQDEIRAVTPGQSAVLYKKEDVIGGGIIV
jgi:tRNA U34 2-thiouridine synthase MnmA/TrmU